jgi:hypothetical protein
VTAHRLDDSPAVPRASQTGGSRLSRDVVKSTTGVVMMRQHSNGQFGQIVEQTALTARAVSERRAVAHRGRTAAEKNEARDGAAQIRQAATR